MPPHPLDAAAASLHCRLIKQPFFIRVSALHGECAMLAVAVSCSPGNAAAWVPSQWEGYSVVVRRSRPPKPAKNKKRVF